MAGPGLCTDCGRRDDCRALCPEAERYADQDHVRLRVGRNRVITVPPAKLLLLADSRPTLGEVSIAPAALGRAEWDLVRKTCRLSPRQRQCVFLVYWGGLSVSQTARVLGVTRGAAARSLGRGREKLRRLSYGGADSESHLFKTTPESSGGAGTE